MKNNKINKFWLITLAFLWGLLLISCSPNINSDNSDSNNQIIEDPEEIKK